LRCNIYYNQVLVQSRLVSAIVLAEPTPTEGALQASVDYTLDRSLRLTRLAELRPHRFSLMLNDNGNGTHSFRFFGGDSVRPMARTLTIPEGTVSGLIDSARKALRHVSWGDDDEWDENKRYRYDTQPDFSVLARDLGRLAAVGYRIYTMLDQVLWISRDQSLAQRIYKADPVQIGLKAGAPFVLPAALIYDYHWDTNSFSLDDPNSKYQLCPSFQKALQDPAPLEDCECFRGQCPVKAEGDRIHSKQDPTRTIKDLGPIICPSGFWGFRHSLGLPVTMSAPFDPDTPDKQGVLSAPITIPYTGTPGIGLAISTDPLFKGFAMHEKKLQDLLKPAAWHSWQEGRTRDDVIKMLRTVQAQLVYFYCHGGASKNRNPFLDVGYNDAWITPDNLLANGIEWRDPAPHPLIFINGCQTVAVAPEQALSFVSAFVYAQAAGVIGTEITVFDTLANDFAEECLSRFVNGLPIGEAVRRARLALLKKRNPLGLVYTPFIVESVRLVKES
jgi:hypothetical protein